MLRKIISTTGAARVIEEKDLTDEKLLSVAEELLYDKAKRDEMGRNAKALAIPDSQEKICDAIISLIG